LEVSTQGGWDEWIAFFLQGVITQSGDAIARAEKLTTLREQYHTLLHDTRAPAPTHQIIDKLFERPATMATLIMSEFGVAHTTAMKYIRILQDHGIVQEVTGRSRDMVFLAKEIVRTTNAPLETL